MTQSTFCTQLESHVKQKKSRVWKATRMLTDVDTEVRIKIHFPSHHGRAGLGSGRFNPNPSPAQRRKLASETVKSFADQKRVAHAHSLARQGVWLQWSDTALPFDFSWKNILFGPGEHLLRFVLHASVNWVRTPDLLRLWGYTNQATCSLCDVPNCTLHHILSNCGVALRQKRYTWRHDSVILCLLAALLQHIESHNSKVEDQSPSFAFVRAGVRVQKVKSKRKVACLLDGVRDWKVDADFDHKQFSFPADICATSQRPDIVLWSSRTKTVILIELTCPAEEGIMNASVRKQDRYTDLLILIRNNHWTPHLFTVEVGARGFVAKSLLKCLKALGLVRSAVSQLAKYVSNISARCSYAIYLAHSSVHWDPKKPLLEHELSKPKASSQKDAYTSDLEAKLAQVTKRLTALEKTKAKSLIKKESKLKESIAWKKREAMAKRQRNTILAKKNQAIARRATKAKCSFSNADAQDMFYAEEIDHLEAQFAQDFEDAQDALR